MNYIELIKKNIRMYGHHEYVVTAGVCPRYSYTIGLTESIGFELICGGMCLFDANNLSSIFFDIISNLKQVRGGIEDLETSLGNFKLVKTHSSWANYAALGAKEYYGIDNLVLYQIVPKSIFTIDDPDMSVENNDNVNGAWKYLSEKWPYKIDKNSNVLLDIQSIMGKKIRVISRYEDDYWEMSSSYTEEINGDTSKIIPMSVIIELYPELIFALDMENETKITIPDK